MADRVKSISKYTGSAWSNGVPIGADATNVDMTTAPSDYDSSSSETSKVLIGTNDVKVIASDTDLTAWGKFNRFRRRVSNKFADYFATANLTGSSTGVTSSGDDTHAYTTAALNNYFNTVIGYQSAADVSTVGSVASQLSSLNDNISDGIGSSSDKFRFGTDGSGTYGYIKKVEGADTFFPFKSGINDIYTLNPAIVDNTYDNAYLNNTQVSGNYIYDISNNSILGILISSCTTYISNSVYNTGSSSTTTSINYKYLSVTLQVSTDNGVSYSTVTSMSDKSDSVSKSQSGWHAFASSSAVHLFDSEYKNLNNNITHLKYIYSCLLTANSGKKDTQSKFKINASILCVN